VLIRSALFLSLSLSISCLSISLYLSPVSLSLSLSLSVSLSLPLLFPVSGARSSSQIYQIHGDQPCQLGMGHGWCHLLARRGMHKQYFGTAPLAFVNGLIQKSIFVFQPNHPSRFSLPRCIHLACCRVISRSCADGNGTRSHLWHLHVLRVWYRLLLLQYLCRRRGQLLKPRRERAALGRRNRTRCDNRSDYLRLLLFSGGGIIVLVF
jgi:hypothetical protein